MESGPPGTPLKTSVDTSPPVRMPRNATHGVSEPARHGRSDASDRPQAGPASVARARKPARPSRSASALRPGPRTPSAALPRSTPGGGSTSGAGVAGQCTRPARGSRAPRPRSQVAPANHAERYRHRVRRRARGQCTRHRGRRPPGTDEFEADASRPPRSSFPCAQERRVAESLRLDTTLERSAWAEGGCHLNPRPRGYGRADSRPRRRRRRVLRSRTAVPRLG